MQDTKLLDGKLSAVERDLGPPYAFPDAIKQLGPAETNRPLPWSDLTEAWQQQMQLYKQHASMRIPQIGGK